MAIAHICDRCGSTFADTRQPTATGTWNCKTVMDGDKKYRIVGAAFLLPVDREIKDWDPRTGQGDKGTPADLCEPCLIQLMSPKPGAAVST